MVDNDHNNDEYKLDDLDLLAVEPEGQLQPEPETADSSRPNIASSLGENPAFRKGLIAVGVLFLLIFCYKFIGSFISGQNATGPAVIVPVAPVKTIVPIENTMNNRTTEPQPQLEPQLEPQLSQKLSTLEEAQKNISTDVLSINNQLSGVSTSMGDMTAKMAELNTLLVALSQKIELQSAEIVRLHATRHPVRKASTMRRVRHASTVYAIQAVIPGRAWLIAGNGSTLTVREGTSIAGYGVVKLIDPKQGRVITSSGQIIRFSQTDS